MGTLTRRLTVPKIWEDRAKTRAIALDAVLPRPVALQPLALKLARTPNRCRTLTGALFRWLFVMTAQLHLAIDALTLQLLLERAQRLVDIIIANDDLHKKPSNSLQCARI